MTTHLEKIALTEEFMDRWMLTECNTALKFNWDILNDRWLLSFTNKLKFSSILVVLAFYVLVYLCHPTPKVL
jgi:hypothetical protein